MTWILLLLVSVILAGLAIGWHWYGLYARALRREAGLVDLCRAQDRWIRRGEMACMGCPDLGACVVQSECLAERALRRADHNGEDVQQDLLRV